jgi:nucleoside-diphosphate-sugar epimerase
VASVGGAGFAGASGRVTPDRRECTLDLSRARTELGYEPVRTREEGLPELARR